MTEPNLLTISIFAFIAVFVLLAVLAVLMHALTVLFPEKSSDDQDAAMLSAIMSAAAAAYPGMRVTHVEEIR